MIRIRIGDDEIALTWDEWESRVRAGRIPPDALVQIAAVTNERFVTASSLESYQALRGDRAAAWRRAFAASPPPLATALIVGINLRVFWLGRMPDVRALISDQLTTWGGAVFENGEAWRLVTMGFAHTDWPHVGLNMVWLAYTGWSLERALGWANLVTIYVGAVVGGAALSTALSPWPPSIGASGGVFGVIAAAVVFGLTRGDLLPERGRRMFGWALLPYMVLILLSGMRSDTTDNWAHFGGMVSGLLLAFALDPEALQRRAGWNRAARGIVWMAVIGTLAVPALVGPRVLPMVDADAVVRELSREEAPEPGEPEPFRELIYDVPTGWSRGLVAGELGFTSRAGPRGFAVRVASSDQPVSAPEIIAQLVASAAPEATAEPVDVEFGGAPGLTARIGLPPGPRQTSRRTLQWWVRTQGRHALIATWECESDAADRLAPLTARLVGSVVWNGPESLHDAQVAYDASPQSRVARRDLARELTAIGQVDDAAALWQGLIDDRPHDESAWVGRLDLAASEPPEAARSVIRAALASAPGPAVVVACAMVLDKHDAPELADGLLEIAWAAAPGDRALSRARRARGAVRTLDAETRAPVELTRDPLGQPREPAAIAALSASPSLEAAERAAAVLADDKRRLVARAAPPHDELLAWVALRYGHLDAAPGTLEGELEAAATARQYVLDGQSLPWVPDDLAQAVRDAHREGPADRPEP